MKVEIELEKFLIKQMDEILSNFDDCYKGNKLNSDETARLNRNLHQIYQVANTVKDLMLNLKIIDPPVSNSDNLEDPKV